MDLGIAESQIETTYGTILVAGLTTFLLVITKPTKSNLFTTLTTRDPSGLACLKLNGRTK